MGYNLGDRMAWLYDLDAAAAPGGVVAPDGAMALCGQHADAAHVPQGWELADDRAGRVGRGGGVDGGLGGGGGEPGSSWVAADPIATGSVATEPKADPHAWVGGGDVDDEEGLDEVDVGSGGSRRSVGVVAAVDDEAGGGLGVVSGGIGGGDVAGMGVGESVDVGESVGGASEDREVEAGDGDAEDEDDLDFEYSQHDPYEDDPYESRSHADDQAGELSDDQAGELSDDQTEDLADDSKDAVTLESGRPRAARPRVDSPRADTPAPAPPRATTPLLERAFRASPAAPSY